MERKEDGGKLHTQSYTLSDDVSEIFCLTDDVIRSFFESKKGVRPPKIIPRHAACF